MAEPQAKFIGAAILFAAAGMGQYHVYSFGVQVQAEQDKGNPPPVIPLNLRPSDWCKAPCDTCQGGWTEHGYTETTPCKIGKYVSLQSRCCGMHPAQPTLQCLHPRPTLRRFLLCFHPALTLLRRLQRPTLIMHTMITLTAQKA